MFASALTLATFALAAFSSVAAVPASAHKHAAIARRGPPPGWPTNQLENYDVYHARYNALDCKDKHDDKAFFDKCCTPMLKNQKLSSRPDECDPDKLPECDDPTPTPSSSKKPTPTPTSTKKTSSSPSKPTSPAGGSGGFDHKGGQATFFFQHGNPGACGHRNPDSLPLVAITSSIWGGSFSRASSKCGKMVRIRNTENGKTVDAVIADACPTCRGGNSLDLSTGAFDKLGSRSKGVLKIEWKFL